MIFINFILLFINLRTILHLFIIDFLLENFRMDKMKFLLFQSNIKNRVCDVTNSFLDTAKIIRNANKITQNIEKNKFSMKYRQYDKIIEI